MSTVLLREPLAPAEIGMLRSEFPHFAYVLLGQDHTLPDAEWADVEILFGRELSSEELTLAHKLRWVHVPEASLNHLCLTQIRKTSNLLITHTKITAVQQVAEFAIAGMLGFAKNLFQWKGVQNEPEEKTQDLCQLMATLQGKTLLQIGLDAVGTAICQLAKMMGMRTWGISDPPSFHPHCTKVFAPRDLHSLLPAAHFVSLVVPSGSPPSIFLAHNQFNLMRDDAIVTLIGEQRAASEEDLFEAAKNGKFRGVLLDTPMDGSSELRAQLAELPQILLTHQVAALPEPGERPEFHLFLYNFRRYLHNDFHSMKNLVEVAT